MSDDANGHHLIRHPKLTVIAPIYRSSFHQPSCRLFSTNRPPCCSCTDSKRFDALFPGEQYPGS